MSQIVDRFICELKEVNESDYGDFMRLSNLYLNEMHREVTKMAFNDVENKIAEMQTYLQFYSNWKVEPTKERLLKDARIVDDLIKSHERDWESGTFGE